MECFLGSPLQTGASVRIHLTSMIQRGRHYYASHNIGEVAEAGKTTQPNGVSWQLTGRTKVLNRVRSELDLSSML